jgi:hypothetical protein
MPYLKRPGAVLIVALLPSVNGCETYDSRSNRGVALSAALTARDQTMQFEAINSGAYVVLLNFERIRLAGQRG